MKPEKYGGTMSHGHMQAQVRIYRFSEWTVAIEGRAFYSYCTVLSLHLDRGFAYISKAVMQQTVTVQGRQEDQLVSCYNNPGKRMTQTKIVPMEEGGKGWNMEMF